MMTGYDIMCFKALTTTLHLSTQILPTQNYWNKVFHTTSQNMGIIGSKK